MSEQSWVETTCPPGWLVQWEAPKGTAVAYRVCKPDEDQHAYLLSGAVDRDGYFIGKPTIAEANRLAWERWAVDVLGERVRWIRRNDGLSHTIVVVDPGPWIYVCHQFPGPLYEIYSDAVHDADGQHIDPGCMVSWTRDPVEALARLAALTLASLGPEAP